MTSRWRDRVVGVGIAAIVFGAYELGRARAQNIPSMPTMFYGVSLDENGSPVTGTRDLRVRFFDGEMGGTQLCETLANSTTVTQGRARIALSETCRAAVQQNANVWVELAVGGNVVGARSRIGAVPYAVEAQRANDLTLAAQQRLLARAECPEGYARDNTATNMVLCRRPLANGRHDEVVRVGTGRTAFWIDRYEASVWSTIDASGSPLSLPDGNPVTPAGVVVPGSEVYALSAAGVAPSTTITYFQAMAACRLAGKSLPTNEEWQWAAMGTPDGGTTNGSGGTCNLNNNGGFLTSGGRSACASRWGSEDHIGNVYEMVTEWATSGITGSVASRWPAGFPADSPNWPSAAAAGVNTADENLMLPSVIARGGFWGSNTGGGTHHFVLGWSVAARNASLGFRCVIR